MKDSNNGPIETLAGLKPSEWKARLMAAASAQGMSTLLGRQHFATYVPAGNTLLVTFETVQGIRALSDKALPLGCDMVKSQDWSHLCLISDGDTWFRDPDVYEFFDGLIDDGFFDGFDNILFYGAGPCGYAAAAFSVAAPGATVLAIQPQATLDPQIAEWDDRFTEMRRICFTDRYGYAPDMLEAASRGFVLYDPRQDLDAMHSALFARPHVVRLRLPNMGSALQTSLIKMKILIPLLTLAGTGQLTTATFCKLYRARRNHLSYLWALTRRLESTDRDGLNLFLCRNVMARMDAPKFAARLETLERTATAGRGTRTQVNA